MTDGSDKVERVTAEQILDATGAKGPVTQGTWTQQAGLRLAAGVGALGTVVTLAIVARWIWASWCWTCPNILSSMKPDEIDSLIKNYKLLQDQSWQSASQMFDTVVVKALLPIFTSILGYIFGAHNASQGNQPSDGNQPNG
jgi:hypothetical protein